MRKERYLLNNNIVCESHLCANIKYTSYSFPDELSVFIYPIWTRIDASVSSGRHDDEKYLHSATLMRPSMAAIFVARASSTS